MIQPSRPAPPSRLSSRTAELAGAVRERREELGLRQSELADLAGCSERFVHTVEHGKTSLRLDKLLDVLEVLGFDLQVTAGGGRIGWVRLDARGNTGEAR